MSATIINETLDSILGGELVISQPRQGYRFSMDAVLLARLARISGSASVLDLGAGCGVVSLLIAKLYKPRRVVALEIQPALTRLITRNAALNRLEMVEPVTADLLHADDAGLKPASFDWVVANPPYRALRAGRESPNPGRRIARAESRATLSDFVAAAARYCRHRGQVAMVLTARRAAELIAELKAHDLEPKRLRMIHPRVELPATAIFAEARKGGGVEVRIEPPLVVYESPGVYSREARSLLFDGSGRA